LEFTHTGATGPQAGGWRGDRPCVIFVREVCGRCGYGIRTGCLHGKEAPHTSSETVDDREARGYCSTWPPWELAASLADAREEREEH
jgi:hypothetical protein